MYEEFFGFTAKPFELVPDPEFLYLSRAHKKAITYLEYGIRERNGFLLITGEIGSGKTTILRNILKNLDEKVTLSKIFNTKVTSEQLLAMINDDFGLDVTGKDKIALLRQLNEFLVDEFVAGRQPVILIDEAQNLDIDLLEEVRLLSNLETDKSKLIQIILVGQPELRRTLADERLRQLRQRICISCHIEHLSKEEVEEYIFHRLEKAGNRSAVEFGEGAIDLIYLFSRGVPRLINIICDFLLLSAFVEEKKVICTDLVKEVIGEIESESKFWGDESGDDKTRRTAANGKVLEEMSAKVTRLEATLGDGGVAGSELLNLSEQIKMLEKILNGTVLALQSRIDSTETSISELRLDIEEIFKLIKMVDKGSKQLPEPTKKGLWSWMTS
ncbi:hypothetical protein ANAEL_02674 [Anaerolineales bacterium]|nr:hypothetical protein ANAEL_02674 [Anaerolineales bacterium]